MNALEWVGIGWISTIEWRGNASGTRRGNWIMRWENATWTIEQ